MRPMIIALPFVLAGCLNPLDIDLDAETPDRAIRTFNGSSVVIQSKSTTPSEADNALARTACPKARYATTNFTIEGVSEYLYLC